MTFKEKTVIRILLLVAKFIAPAEWQKEVESLATHISRSTLNQAHTPGSRPLCPKIHPLGTQALPTREALIISQ